MHKQGLGGRVGGDGGGGWEGGGGGGGGVVNHEINEQSLTDPDGWEACSPGTPLTEGSALPSSLCPCEGSPS